jgi:hypothetical protein
LLPVNFVMFGESHMTCHAETTTTATESATEILNYCTVALTPLTLPPNPISYSTSNEEGRGTTQGVFWVGTEESLD